MGVDEIIEVIRSIGLKDIQKLADHEMAMKAMLVSGVDVRKEDVKQLREAAKHVERFYPDGN